MTAGRTSTSAGRVFVALVVLGSGVLGVAAQERSASPGHPFPDRWPFAVGELAEYDVTFGPVRVGRARLSIEAVDTIRATPAVRLAFELEGGVPFYRLDDRTVSWLARGPFRSLRFEQILSEGDYRRHRRWEIDHEAGTATREDWDEAAGGYRPHRRDRDLPIPPAALDEISLLYLTRLLPLEIGRTYRFDSYFEEEGNPIIVEVLRRERVRVRAGRFDTVVLRPIIRTDGMFGEDGRAEVYITDDDRRLIVQIKSRMRVGSIDMYLRSFSPDT